MNISRRLLIFALSVTVLTTVSPISSGASAEVPSMPPARYVETNGIRMAVYEAGSGPAIVLLHGFPELAHSWRNQIPVLVDAGYHVIAPDLRGYGLTDRPAAVEDYDLAHLMDDLVGLLDALDIEQAVWMGHDWGGILAWQMPLFHPSRSQGVISVGTPHIPHWQFWLQPELIAGLAPEGFVPDPLADPVQQMRQVYNSDMYVLMMLDGDEGDRLLALDPGRSFRSMVRKNVIAPDDYFSLPAEYRQMAFYTPLGSPEGALLGEDILTDDELAFFAASFTRTTFTPAANWYRNLSRNWEAGLTVDQTVRVPSLMIAASDDVVFTPRMAEGMHEHVPDLEVVVVAGAGHWTQIEKPQEVNEAALAWLATRFPSTTQ